MNKRQYYSLFDGQISNTAIHNINGEWQIVGKWCRVSIEQDGQIDLFICNTSDMYAGLGTRKLQNIISSLRMHVETTFTEGNGEAWVKLKDKNIILQNLVLLGIRRKRRVNYQQLAHVRSSAPLMRGASSCVNNSDC